MHEEPFYDTSKLLTTSSQQIGPLDIISYGYLSEIILLVEATGGAGGAAVAKEKAPFNVINGLYLQDVNGSYIFGPYDGYETYLVNKYGGYDFVSDPKVINPYSAIDANGNFTFILRIPVEINSRDAIGCLPNMNASQAYKLGVTLAQSTDIYSTPPAGALPTVRIRAVFVGRDQPEAVNAAGNPQQTTPPEYGTTQYWTKTIRDVASGQVTIPLSRVGNLVRNIIIYSTGAADGLLATGETNFPDPLELHLDARLLTSKYKKVFKDQMARAYGFSSSSAFGALDSGVYVYQFTDEWDGHPGGELGDMYLPTAGGSRLELRGTFGAASKVTILTNDVVPVGPVL
jgi:hypothetical protein